MHTPPRILIVEDEHALALAFAAAARQAGAASELAATAAQARRLLEGTRPFDAMILDIGLPDENGLAFLAGLPESARPPAIVVTAHGEIVNAIAARKLGVREFFTKPLEFPAFHSALSSLLRAPNARLPPSPSEASGDGAFIGAAPSMRPVFRQIAQACASDEPVLVRGETGSGKTRVSRLIAEHSRRTTAPFHSHAASNSSIQETLAKAQGGTLLVEDLASLPSSDQALLVRGIESAEDGFPRILATVQGDLEASLLNGALRSDLYYRLQVLEVTLPPLRERIEDLPTLADFFAAQLAPGHRSEFSPGALSILRAHQWPGNLRELRNAISFALTAAAGAPALEDRHLPVYLAETRPGSAERGDGDHLPEPLLGPLRDWIEARLGEDPQPTYRELSESLESGLLRELLPRYGGRLSRLAKDLQANRATLRKRLHGKSQVD